MRIMAPITFRLDEESERALAVLTADGRSVSVAIRDALVHEARRLTDERLRAEALALVADPEDVAEARRVLEDLEPLRAW